MSFHAKETFQVFCAKCWRKFEAESREAAVAAVEAHERDPLHDQRVQAEKAKIAKASGK